jgi:spore coat polysaccharide biosynthesis protein SpsF
MASTRLPGKILMPLGSMPILGRLVERVRHIKYPCHLIVATTTNSMDELIVQWCRSMSVAHHRGSELDVLERYYEAASLAKCKTVIRITSDCPLLDPALIDQAIETYLGANVDYLSNMHPPTWPYGMAVEIFSFDALRDAQHEAKDPSEREHVTPFLYRRPERFKMKNLENPVDLSHLRWTVDTPEDYSLVTKLFEAAYAHDPHFDLRTLIHVIEDNPEWSNINRHIQQKNA